MTKLRRVGNAFTGFLIVICGLLFALFPTESYKFIVTILGLSLVIWGIRDFIYYITMAKRMVGGRSVLYRAVITFDVGLFTLSLTDVPLIYVMLYLAGIHLFSGAIDMLRAREAKAQEGSWKMQFIHGLVNVIMAGLCLAFIGSTATAVEIYAIGLIYSGIMRIIQAFRRTAIVYIQ